MSNAEKKYDSVASILTTAYNLAQKFMEYQDDKKKEARDFSKKIDKLTLLAKRRERIQSRKKMASMTDDEKKILEQEEIERKEFENLTIDTITIVDGLLASPAGLDESFLMAATTYLRQKSSEKKKELTSYFIQDVRDTFLVRLAQDAKIWDTELRQTLQKTMSIVQNVAIGFRRDSENTQGQQNPKLPQEQNEGDKKEGAASAYNVF